MVDIPWARPLQASDIHENLVDPDVDVLVARLVEVRMVATHDLGDEWLPSPEKVAEYQVLYEKYGPWALPPVVYANLNGKPLMLTGCHRNAAAFRAGLTEIPAFVVIDGMGASGGSKSRNVHESRHCE